jgi:glucosamine--fructose-6-phosphate aminotransferase (isomerizing)
MSILRQEIHEQPEAAARFLERERHSVERLGAKLRGRFDYVLVAARGSSDNAARYAQYLFGVHNRLPVALATPSLFTLYAAPPRLGNALVLAISQSGQSPDIVAVLEHGRSQGRPAVAITNVADSPLAAAADDVIPLHAGPERATAATKTYTNSLCALASLSLALAGDGPGMAELGGLPERMRLTLEGAAPPLRRVERYRYMDRCAVLGRGFNYATTYEIALKVKELTRTVAEPYSSADFRHGPIALAGEGFPAIVIATRGMVFDDMRSLVDELRRRGCDLIVISDDEELLGPAHLGLPLPVGMPEWLSPMVAVLPGQLFSLGLAEAKGFDADRPAGITKVTETF